MRRSILPHVWVCGVLLAGCAADKSPSATNDTGTASDTLDVDADGDGVVAAEDCDDTDAAVGAVAADADCDGILGADDCDDDDAGAGAVADDGDCDGVATADDCDDDDAGAGAVADDGDCDGVATADDCDDTNPDINPGAAEMAGDEVDQDCDGTEICYVDADGDGFRVDATTTIISADTDCSDPGEALGTDPTGDCDDGDASLNQDDMDADGYSTCDEDCDDLDGAVSPGAVDTLFKDLDCTDGIADTSLLHADYSFVGEGSYDNSGWVVSSAGDVDGDGLGDILVGAPYNSTVGTFSGSTYLILGASLGSSSEIDLSLADYIFVGEFMLELAGYSVSGVGDVDGDGLDDLVVGAPYQDAGGSISDDRGKIYLILGASLGDTPEIDLSLADYSFVGEGIGDYAGWSVSGAGDVDDDGLGDILVGAYLYGGGFDKGRAYLVLGASLGMTSEIDLSLADYSFTGEYPNDYAGWSVSGAGDVDGDGRDDILVGSFGNDAGGVGSGKAYLILGGSLGATSEISLSMADYSFVGEGAGDSAGRAVSGAGDVDGDGLDDILVGSYANGDGVISAGKAYLILGVSLGATSEISLSMADYSFAGEADGDKMGWSLAGVGDVDADGFDDILVGAPYNEERGSRTGKVYLILGASLGATSEIDLSLTEYTFTGETIRDQAGMSVSGAGDVDGDGRDDLLVGAPYVDIDDVETAEGKTYLILSGL